MNKNVLKPTLIAAGILAAIGAIGAQAYYTHELAERVAVQEFVPQPTTTTDPRVELGDPWATLHTDMMRMQAQMDQMFEPAFGDFDAVGSAGQQANAKVTLKEQGDNYVVKANVPGANESDIDVNLDGRLLSISSEYHGGEKRTADNGQVIGQESYASTFQRAFTLPGPVKAAGMQTRFKDGILTVTIPKAAS